MLGLKSAPTPARCLTVGIRLDFELDRVRVVNDVDVESGLATRAGHQTTDAQDPLVRDDLADQAAQIARTNFPIHTYLRLRPAIRSGPQHVYYRSLFV